MFIFVAYFLDLLLSNNYLLKNKYLLKYCPHQQHKNEKNLRLQSDSLHMWKRWNRKEHSNKINK